MPAKLKFPKHLSAMILALGFAAAPAFAAGPATHDHGHDQSAAPATFTLDAGKKWATDAPLRKAMANIRTSMQASLQPIHEDKFSPAKYGSLARKINGEVANMVNNCKLEPKADAQLHLVIAQLLEGAEAMEGRTKAAKRMDGAIAVLGALEKYGSYFDDPSWKPIKH